ncbi:MAG: Dam family site-specific DNA-(adenine-N6)-methyltransferase [Bacillota bacterium]
MLIQSTMDKNSPEEKTPLLKWPGGKRGILKWLLPLIPDIFESYYEPFLGGGALFFAISPSKGVVADNNPDLVNCYVQVRNHPDEVIDCLTKLKNTKEDYYTARKEVPLDDIAKAARVIYLMSLSFNGIYRLNLKGEFNVPYGHKTHLQPCNPERIRAVSATLMNVDIICADFAESVANAKKGDLVYLDPPYTVAHSNNGFLKYNSKIFSWKDQERLATVASNLAERGCKVIISNANHSSIYRLYPGFKKQLVERPSVIAASSEFRKRITECIFYNEV